MSDPPSEYEHLSMPIACLLAGERPGSFPIRKMDDSERLPSRENILYSFKNHTPTSRSCAPRPGIIFTAT